MTSGVPTSILDEATPAREYARPPDQGNSKVYSAEGKAIRTSDKLLPIQNSREPELLIDLFFPSLGRRGMNRGSVAAESVPVTVFADARLMLAKLVLLSCVLHWTTISSGRSLT
jgi:hypothetical protein